MKTNYLNTSGPSTPPAGQLQHSSSPHCSFPNWILKFFHLLPEVEDILLGVWEELGSGGGVDMPQ